MSDKYSDEEVKVVGVLVNRLFARMKKSCLTYRQMAPIVRAKSHVTLWRWFNGQSLPSKTHIYWIKRYLGYAPGN